MHLCYCEAAELTGWSIRAVLFKREEPDGVGIERMRHVTSKPRNLPRRSESSQQVKPSGANSPETLDLSELIRPREA